MGKRSFVNLLVTFIITLSIAFSSTVLSQENGDNAVISIDFPITDLMPIADLHFHPGSDVAYSPADIIRLMNDTGVKWAGSGSISGQGGNSRLWEEYAQKMGDRLIPFAGQRELNRAYFQGGLGGMEDPEMLEDFLQEVEYDLESGNVKGIGEIFINNMHSNKNPKFRRKAQADADTFTVLYQLISQHDAFLTFHMEGDSDSLEQMENLLSSSRKGRILWNHCGTNTSSSDVRRMMSRNSNLYCEFSFRYLHEMSSRNIFSASGIDSGWRELIEDFPDRFMVGTDAHSANDYREYIEVVRSGLLANLSDETAEKVAYKNAQYLFNLK
jgi:predicted TIM-barrel fold metal-dependent hydrolase